MANIGHGRINDPNIMDVLPDHAHSPSLCGSSIQLCLLLCGFYRFDNYIPFSLSGFMTAGYKRNLQFNTNNGLVYLPLPALKGSFNRVCGKEVCKANNIKWKQERRDFLK